MVPTKARASVTRSPAGDQSRLWDSQAVPIVKVATAASSDQTPQSGLARSGFIQAPRLPGRRLAPRAAVENQQVAAQHAAQVGEVGDVALDPLDAEPEL